MHRHGQIPLVKYGFRLTATYKVEESQNQTSNEKIDATQKQLEPETPLDSKQLPAKNRPIAIPSQNQPEVKPSMTETSIRRIPPPSDTLVFVKFSNLIQTSSMKLWSNTCKISQTLPARLQKYDSLISINLFSPSLIIFSSSFFEPCLDPQCELKFQYQKDSILLGCDCNSD